jgi:hypothetical protein
MLPYTMLRGMLRQTTQFHQMTGGSYNKRLRLINCWGESFSINSMRVNADVNKRKPARLVAPPPADRAQTHTRMCVRTHKHKPDGCVLNQAHARTSTLATAYTTARPDTTPLHVHVCVCLHECMPRCGAPTISNEPRRLHNMLAHFCMQLWCWMRPTQTSLPVIMCASTSGHGEFSLGTLAAVHRPRSAAFKLVLKMIGRTNI